MILTANSDNEVQVQWDDQELIDHLDSDITTLSNGLAAVAKLKLAGFVVKPGGKPTLLQFAERAQEIARETLTTVEQRRFERIVKKFSATTQVKAEEGKSE